MAIISTDLKWKLSEGTGPGNTNAGTPAGSLGGWVSTTAITDASLHNLFDVITPAENTASDVEYRCLFVHNDHATDTLSNARVWITSQTSGGASIQIATDDEGASPKGQAGAQADEVVNESTAPTAIGTWQNASNEASALSLGTLAAGQVYAIWLKRAAANTGALAVDGANLRLKGDL